MSIAKSAPGIDRDLRGLADDYGMTDMMSNRDGGRVMPKPTVGKAVPYQPAAGWRMNVNTNEAGALIPTCAPAGVTSKVVAEIGKVQPKNKLRGPTPVVEASHRASIPK